MIIKCYDCFQDYESEFGVCPHCGFSADQDTREPNHLPVGTVLQNRYLIGKVCGFGGFGVTYKAFDRELEAVVAIKEYFPNTLVNRVPGRTDVIPFSGKRLDEFQLGKQRFLNEARITARYASHKNIVNVLDFFEENQTAYIVMEFLNGIDLAEYLETATGGTERISVDQAVDIALSICNALKSIHKDSILHRDISPDNIYLCLNNTIKLYDFGAARFSDNKDKLLTVILKPGYAPVEQYVEENVKVNNQGPWTDIYALGATMYKMITGIKPIESMNRKVNDELQGPNEIVPDIPQYLNDAIMKAMAVEPHLRFQTVEEFEAVLKKEKKVVPVKTTIRRKKRIRFIGISALSAAVLTGFIIFAANWFEKKENNTLPTASIKVWYVQDSDASSEAIHAVKEEFCKSFENVTVELSGYPSERYQQQLAASFAGGAGPSLFQFSNIKAAAVKTAPLDDLLKHLDLDQYWFLDQVKDEILKTNKLPVAFDLPVFYLNTTMNAFGGSKVSSLSEILGEEESLSVSEKCEKDFDKMFPNAEITKEPYDKFLHSVTPLLFSSAADYFNVRKALPGRYRLLSANLKNAAVKLTNHWSLAPTEDSDEAKCAQRFLEYLLSDNAQDYLYIRNEIPGLPVNKNALSIYKDVYRNDVENLLSDVSAYQVQFE